MDLTGRVGQIDGFELHKKTNSMRFKRAKQVKRNMNIYCHSFGFRTPYQVILDGNFMQVARATGKNLEEALPDFLGGPCRLSRLCP